MEVNYFDFETIGKFSVNDIAYAQGNNGLENFYQFAPSYENLSDAARQRDTFTVDRELLVQVIRTQYEAFCQDPEVIDRIERLNDPNTFTIITAHQPTLFTGPLYFIYKCLSAIKVADQFNTAQDDYHTQPVLILGGEDHDFDEMNHLNIFGKTVTWEDHQGGAVGRYRKDSLEPVLEEVYDILGQSENAQTLIKKFKTSFSRVDTYGAGMQRFVHELIGHLGILVVNMDEPAFKRKMIPIFKDDIENHTSYTIVRDIQSSFSEAGFEEQAYVRPINLFYLTDHDRDRIEENDGVYHTVNGDKKWDKSQLLNEIEEHPERFSPNVILRPIYQELIFPNLAYVGGGGEISYWLERKAQFEKLGVFYPMLIRRDSFQLISTRDLESIQELGFSLEDMMLPEHKLVEKYLSLHGREEIDLSADINKLNPLEEIIQQKVEAIDPSLVARIGAQFAKFKNDLHGVEKRLKKTEKKSHDNNIKKIKKIQNKLFPDHGLQERTDNFMSWYILHGEGFFKELLKQADPFDTRLKTLVI
ncbi:bacillithiol biosynthesis cysteine-adding enzyme BshC [Membranicola marinus]|uniref:Putative cysteine ligase BshC n=1 Tax=Membranihabitans marinus TaxID=1227546 RepID=A0A953HL14_9BACT|nr:bacillithiol biosynthesis cysteine-adding enzyme BshC [Membranihabitans marinus]MBY5957019.1 bacillithiol biosynthesis cysteine-adding enzyme BshC [Membranihabitans marinus]